MSVPTKFRDIGDFHEYYSGVRTAPYLTVFVGGNHEASNHLFELYYGGWVAPNIYYLGAANVVCYGPLRIAGLSGIWKGYNYNKPHHERLPYNQDDIKSIYHVRELDVRKLLLIRKQVDIGISHDWPRGVEWLGNWKALFTKKDLFEADARAGTLGSPAANYVLDRLRPPHWFAAHLHCKFSATIRHHVIAESPDNPPLSGPFDSVAANRRGPASNAKSDHAELHAAGHNSILSHNLDEIDLDLNLDSDEENADMLDTSTAAEIPSLIDTKSSETPSTVPDDIRAQLPPAFSRPVSLVVPLPAPKAITNTVTSFLALDKCLPYRKFLQILEIEPISVHTTPMTTRPYALSYDKEWLSITRTFASELVLGDPSARVPQDQGEAHYRSVIDMEELWVEKNLVESGKMTIPENFERTAPVYDPAVGIDVKEQPPEYTNRQTAHFCHLVGIPNPFDISEDERAGRRSMGPRPDASGRGAGRENGRRGDGRPTRGGRGGRAWGRGKGRGRA